MTQKFSPPRQNLQGSFLLEELDERVSSHDYPADKQTRVSFTLQGGRDRLQRLFLDLNVKADMPLICQRCITPMPFLLDETSRIVCLPMKRVWTKPMLADEELEGMLLEKELDVRTLVEDQILMSPPFLPSTRRLRQQWNTGRSQSGQTKPLCLF